MMTACQALRTSSLAAIFAAATTWIGLAQQPAKPVISDRGVARQTPAPPVQNGHRYVVAIGINAYSAWPHLDTAVNDAQGFAALLHDQFGFDLAAPPLLEGDATQRNIASLIDDLRNKLKPGDDLVFFFAGHGTTREDHIGTAVSSVGFLVPVDARASGANEHWSDYIEVDEFLRNVSTLPAGHILVILDSCHAGMALGNKFVSTRDDVHFKRDLANNLSRKVIASAEAGQSADDHGGPLPGHSLFTGLMMEGLMSGKADLFATGLVTSSQLGAYTQHEVSVAPNSRQTPVFGGFDLDAGGEVVFPIHSDFQALYHQARAALLVPDEQTFLNAANKAIVLRPDAPESLWMQYRADLAQKKIEIAEKDLETLSDHYFRDRFSLDAVPMNVRSSGGLGFRLHYWKTALESPNSQENLAISISYIDAAGKEHNEPVAPGGKINLTPNAAFDITVTNQGLRPLTIGALMVTDAGDIDVATANPDDTAQRIRTNQQKLSALIAGVHLHPSDLNSQFSPETLAKTGSGTTVSSSPMSMAEYFAQNSADAKQAPPPQRPATAEEREELLHVWKELYDSSFNGGNFSPIGFGGGYGVDTRQPDPESNPAMMVFPGQSVRWTLRGDGEEEVDTFHLLLSPYTIHAFINPPSTVSKGGIGALDAPGVTQTSFSLRLLRASATK